MKNKHQLIFADKSGDLTKIMFHVDGPDLKDIVYRLSSLWLFYAGDSAKPLSPKEKYFLYLCVVSYMKNGCTYCPESVSYVSSDPKIGTKQQVYKLRGDLIDKGFMIKIPTTGKREATDIVPLFKLKLEDGKISFNHQIKIDLNFEGSED